MFHPDIPTEYQNQIVTGDARELSARIPDESIDLIFTDPVYERIEDYAWLGQEAARVLKPRGALLTFIGINHLERTMHAMAGGLPFRGMITWNLKGPANKRYGRAIDNGAWILWYGGWSRNYAPLVWDSLAGENNFLHFKWQKNPLLIARHIKDFSLVDSVVADFFCGSGTVPAMCKMLNRNYIAFEINAETAAKARTRVEQTQAMHPAFTVDQEVMAL